MSLVLPARRGTIALIVLVAAAIGALMIAVPVRGATRCPTVTVTGRANRHTVSVLRCARLVIRLREAFDGGYSWQVRRRPARRVITLVSSRAVYPRNRPGMVGGYDTRVLTYRADGPGRTTLTLAEVRSGDAAHPVARYRLTVRVS
ncbi:MAG TPA: protease inhibitor I42 family protein [Solirubrobacteraceae bacterium]|nr:protease inhibitor I42 family protein [Solirubrobacteraceae bacterium]